MNFTFLLYIICELISLLFMYLSKKDHKFTKFFFFLSFLPFAILFILRSETVGTDYKYYADTYLSLINGTITLAHQQWFSFGFKVILQFLTFFFGPNYYIIFAIINTISLYLVYITIYKYSEKPVLSLFIYFCFCLHFQIFNQFRQMFAVGIIFFAFRYIKEKNIYKYMITIILAGLIHSSALIMIPAYFITNIKFNKKRNFIFLLITLFLFINFNLLRDILSPTYFGRVYLNSSFDTKEISSVLNLIVRILLFLLVNSYYKKIIKNQEDNTCINFLYNNVLICTLLQILVTKMYILARLTTYFYIYYILLIPIIYDYIIKKTEFKKFWKISFVIVLICYQIIYYNSSSGAVRAKYDNYTTFIND